MTETGTAPTAVLLDVDRARLPQGPLEPTHRVEMIAVSATTIDVIETVSETVVAAQMMACVTAT